MTTLLLLRLPLLLSSLLLLVFGGRRIGVLCDEVRITSVDKLIQFKNNVNSGNNYSGTTVFLDSDLPFAGKTFEPIGNKTCYFSGVFYGQGHVISNLAMTSSLQYVGLFGYSRGLAIKNVILGSSYSITSLTNDVGAWTGGIIGHAYFASSENCVSAEKSLNAQTPHQAIISLGTYFLKLQSTNLNWTHSYFIQQHTIKSPPSFSKETRKIRNERMLFKFVSALLRL